VICRTAVRRASATRQSSPNRLVTQFTFWYSAVVCLGPFPPDLPAQAAAESAAESADSDPPPAGIFEGTLSVCLSDSPRRADRTAAVIRLPLDSSTSAAGAFPLALSALVWAGQWERQNIQITCFTTCAGAELVDLLLLS